MNTKHDASCKKIRKSAKKTRQNGTNESGQAAAGIILKGRYLLTQLIASGGTSDIYRAQDLLAGSIGRQAMELAIKIPRSAEFAGAELGAQACLHEVATARRLRHTNILGVYGFDRSASTCFLTMEYLHGESLAERLQRSPGRRLAMQEAVRVATAAAAGLAAAHAQGVIHSDLKPGNILLGECGSIKLIDFAAARADARARHPGASEAPAYLGYSPAYASPEQLAEQPAHPADDVYSLACVVYEMLSGEHPFQRQTATAAAREGRVPQRPAALSGRQWRALRKGLHFERTRRYSDANVFIQALSAPTLGRRRHRAALAVSILLGASALTAGEALRDHRERIAELTALERQLQQAEALAEQIRSAPPTERPRLVPTVDQLAEPFRSAVLAQLQQEVTTALPRQIEHELRIQQKLHSPAELRQLITTLQRYYPDSANLQSAAELAK